MSNVTKFLIRLVVVFSAFLYMALIATGPTYSDAGEGKPLAVGSPDELASHLSCWDAEHPALTDHPTHVVYRYDGDWKVGGTAKVSEALDNIFGVRDTGLVVYVFCV